MAERRTVLKVLAGAAGAAAVGAGVVPAAALVAEPAGEGSGGEDGAAFLRVARLDALARGRPTRAPVVGAEVDAWTRAPDRRLGAVWLIRDDETTVRAFSTVCPHLGCGIELARDHFTCPCHESSFDLSGNRTSGPSPRGLDPLEVRVADGWVSVRYRRFRLGVSQRITA